MSDRQLRSTNRLDYRTLHNTGRRVIKSDSSSESGKSDSEESDSTLVSENSSGSEASLIANHLSLFSISDMSTENTNIFQSQVEKQRLISLQESLQDDINDFIDENPYDELLVIDDVVACVSKTEDLRSRYRSVHKELRALDPVEYDENRSDTYEYTLKSIKDYISKTKLVKSKMRNGELNVVRVERLNKEQDERAEFERRVMTADFMCIDIDRLLDTINKDIDLELISDNRTVVSDEDLVAMRSKLPNTQKRVDNVSEKLSEVIAIAEGDLVKSKVKSLGLRYENAVKIFTRFQNQLHKEIKSRELDKEKGFKTSSLNIEIPKYKGYDSVLDVYTFRDKFEKLHSSSVPKRLMPEFLKNNYLEGPALEHVKRLETIEEIWTHLIKAFGDSRVMLMKKLAELDGIGSLARVYNAEKIKESLSKVVNVMHDLMRLAKRHDIEEKLYNGDGIYSIYKIVGDHKVTKFIEKTYDDQLKGEDLWQALVEFLDKDIKIQLERSMIQRTQPEKTNPSSRERHDKEKKSGSFHTENSENNNSNSASRSISKKDQKTCFLCGKDDHVATKGPYGKKLIQYYSCESFATAPPSQRFGDLKRKGLCHQCLFPGASASTGKHAEGKCQDTYVCKHESHGSHKVKKHVLVCDEHKDDQANKDLLEEYRSRCITRNSDLPEFAKTIQLSFYCLSAFTSKEQLPAPQNQEWDGIYLFQQIQVKNEYFTIFFDNGCGDLVVTHQAIQRLGANARQVYHGTVSLGGVGGLEVESPHGAYQISLPLHNGKNAVMTGLVLEEISNEFPNYILNKDVESDIQAACVQTGGNVSELPRLPNSVGGRVDIMIGVKYLRYFPKEIFKCESGLTIFLSSFLNVDGTMGVVAGPHASFTAANSNFFAQRSITKQYQSFLTFQAQLYRNVHLFHDGDDCQCDMKSEIFASKNQKSFEQVDSAGSEITYRCVTCRKCIGCKNGERIEMISTREEVEQAIIEKSVHVDLQRGITTASLPFIEDPVQNLKSNKSVALTVYKNQVKKLEKNPQNKADVISSEAQLQKLGFVDFVMNLTKDEREQLFKSALKYFIPWRAVWNLNSLSTLCRLVFDGTMPTASGKSLNSVVAKGQNKMNKLVEILLRWFIKVIAFHTDVRKMYNSLKLVPSNWCYQMYLWENDLDPSKEPVEKVVKTVIYGIKSSGNQAEYGLRQTASLQKEKYPRVNEIVHNDVYVDDCLSGEDSLDEAHQSADQLDVVLAAGGFALKGFTFSGSPPPSDLSSDGESIKVTGLKWFPKSDMIRYDLESLNFGIKQRGKKSTDEKNFKIPSILTRKHCMSKVYEIYDIAGKLTPITAAMKIDLHELVVRGIQLKDKIPDELRPIWNSHFEMMQEIHTLQYRRSVVPDDAASLEIDTIDTGDASKSIACIAIYARFKRRNGEYSCQLVFARSKLIEDGTTQPRAELTAALLNAHTGEVVRRSFGKYHSSSIKLGDNQIVLHWINNDQKALKQWVRTRVIEILRFTLRAQWFFIESKLLIADLGTRRGANLTDVDMHSDWINGLEWMRKDPATFPIYSVLDLKLNESEHTSYQKEVYVPYFRENDLTSFDWPHPQACLANTVSFHSKRSDEISKHILARYQYSCYLLDPNKHSFSAVVRIMAIVLKFLNNLKERIKGKGTKKCSSNESSVVKSVNENLKNSEANDNVPLQVFLTDDEISLGRNYYFKKATSEVFHFTPKSHYEKISTYKNNILYYTGRILETQTVESVVSLPDAMKDLSCTSFFVPIVDVYSPIAYSVINDIHWNHKVANHRGVETVYRYVLQSCYVIEGRNLVKKFRKNCARCRYLAKRTVDIEMGPISSQNITIAPAFYISQTDIAGPFLSYSPHNKRTVVKVYFVVFCCSTTSSVNLKVMEDYSSSAFLQAFTRFACEVGYPKILVSDEGSQLVKGYENMHIDFSDLKNRLHLDMGVDFQVCPVGGHNMIGKVERTVREVKESIQRSFQNRKLSILQWETVGAEIANTMNDLPLALGNIVSDFENMDLVTPNRLKLGRNNDRSPVGVLDVTNDPSKFFKENKDIFESWFNTWLISHVPKLMNHPKWYKTEYHIQKGDIVLFLKKEGLLNGTYQYGMIETAEPGRDGKVRSAVVQYRNHNEEFNRQTHRAVRELIVIHKIDELNIIQELGKIATIADMKCKLASSCN